MLHINQFAYGECSHTAKKRWKGIIMEMMCVQAVDNVQQMVVGVQQKTQMNHSIGINPIWTISITLCYYINDMDLMRHKGETEQRGQQQCYGTMQQPTDTKINHFQFGIFNRTMRRILFGSVKRQVQLKTSFSQQSIAHRIYTHTKPRHLYCVHSGMSFVKKRLGWMLPSRL